MFQNLISLEISNEQLKEVHGALAVLEKNLDGLISLSVAGGMSWRRWGRSRRCLRARHMTCWR